MNDLKPLVVLAAGGTGGHMFPAQALATELAGRGCRLALVTDRRGDAWQGGRVAVETHRIRAGGLAGKSFMARLQSGPELAIGTWQARKLLKRLNPSAVVGFGGYASVPTMLAARFGGYPAAIHGSCEDYRAAATIDLVHDEADLAGHLACPVLALWGAKGAMERNYDVLAAWRERASDVRGLALPCGHFLAEEAPAEVIAESVAFLRG